MERVEAARVCYGGESVQGSHVLAERAAYVLQWRAGPAGAALMYYTETLASHHYRYTTASTRPRLLNFV